MSDVAVHVESLGKRYRLGHSVDSSRTLREALAILPRSLVRLGLRNILPRRSGTSDPTALDGGRSSSDAYIWALRDIDLEVKHGEVVGIIGRNGAGKSTLLKILSRITCPTTGRAVVWGRLASLLEVGTGFHPELTGRENIYLNGTILGMKKTEIDRAFDDIVEFAEISPFLDTPVKRYSSGMYVRLAFAVAAHVQPEILVVDEVLAVGDAAFQRKCLQRMNDVAGEGRTVLFVSHNMAAVGSLCRRAVLLEEGRVSNVGETGAVIQRYLVPAGRQSTSFRLATSNDNSVQLKSVSLRGKGGDPVEVVLSGQPLRLELDIECQSDFGDAIVSIGIDSATGGRVALLTNVFFDRPLRLSFGVNRLICHVPVVPLVAGMYQLSIKISNVAGVAIWAPRIANLHVEKGDFFGTGRMLAESWVGSVLIQHSWESHHGVE